MTHPRLRRELDKLVALGICRDVGALNLVIHEPGIGPDADESALLDRNGRFAQARESKSLWFRVPFSDRPGLFYFVCLDLRGDAYGQLVVRRADRSSTRANGADCWHVTHAGPASPNGQRAAWA